MLLAILFLAFIFIVYKWSTATFDYFKKHGIEYRKPIPFLGSNGHLFTRKNLVEILEDFYYEFINEKVSGIFDFRRPVVFLRDPKIIKQLTVKEFEYFTDHRVIITEDIDPFFGNTLFALQGQKWRDMRGTLSPAFTASKMRLMMDFVSQVALQTDETMRKDIEDGGQNKFEFKAVASKFTLDIIASTSFGIEINSFKNPDNEFSHIAKKITDLASVRTAFVLAGYVAFPNLMKAFKINLLDKKCSDFFQNAIIETLKKREECQIVRNDMLNLLLEVRKGQTEGIRKWTDTELAAQCFIFFAAGFDTVAQTMSFLAYELACNPDIQQKLFNEIYVINKEIDGKINYEQVQSMKYLDQVVSETLRKWPAAPVIDRVCEKEYELKFDGKHLKIEKDILLGIPIWAIQRDPKYFPNPLKFDPDRFSDENKSKIDPDTYLPFGIGPRNCIGSRFALMEIKIIFYYLLLNFSIEVTEKTQIPLKFKKSAFQLLPEKGIWLELKPRGKAEMN